MNIPNDEHGSVIYLDEQDSFFEDNLPPLVEEGIYRLKYLDYCTFKYMSKYPKLRLRFCIVDHPDWNGVVLERFYNVIRLREKIGLDGKFTASKRGLFAREFRNLFPEVALNRPDRSPMSYFRNKVIIGKISTVTSDDQSRPIHSDLQYSRIARLIKLGEVEINSDLLP